MRKCVLTLAMVLVMSVCANAGVITQWNYNDRNIIPDIGTGTQSLVGSAVFDMWGYDGDTDPALSGDSYVIKNINTAGAGLEWAVPTTGFQNISISLETWFFYVRSPELWTWSYDAGAGWVDSSDVSITYYTGGTRSLDLSAVSAVANNSNFKFRLTCLEPNPLSNDNVIMYHDMVTVLGLPVPEPSGILVLISGAGCVGGWIIRRRI